MLDSFRTSRGFSETSEVEEFTEQSEEIDWKGFNKTIYRLVKAKEEFDLDMLALLWLKLG